MIHTFEITTDHKPQAVKLWCWKNLHHKWAIDQLEAQSTPEQEVRSRICGIPLKRFLGQLPKRHIITIHDDNDALFFKMRWS